MHVLFVHRNFPAQFGHIATHLAQDLGHECTFLTTRAVEEPGPLRVIRYEARTGATAKTHYCSRTFENYTWHGHAVYEALKRHPEVQPDLIVGHSGLGPTMFLRDLHECPLINYFEYFYRGRGSDLDFHPEFPPVELDFLRCRTRNAALLLDLHQCSAGYCPTAWQRSLFPQEYQPKLETIFDGVDTGLWRPRREREELRHRVLGGRLQQGMKIVTYVSRGFEVMRGFDVFMKAAARISAMRSDTLFVCVGEKRSHYGGDERFLEGKTLFDHVMARTGIDPSRFIFPGRLPQEELAKLLSLSDLHVYLTAPFVLSWSLINAMASGCVVLASRTAPVEEAIEDGANGLLADFFDVDSFVRIANKILDDPPAFRQLGRAARRTAVERYSTNVCLPRIVEFYTRVAESARTSARSDVKARAIASLAARSPLATPTASPNDGLGSHVQAPSIISNSTELKRVLHVGCGPKRRDKLHPVFCTEDWQEIRVDINRDVQPDIVASMTAMPQIPNNSVDAIWSSHNLEHLYWHEVALALAEFLRVLKTGGFLLFSMPDLQKAAEYLVAGKFEEPIYQSPAGPIAAIDICFGHRASIACGNHFMAHKTGFSARLLTSLLARHGFQAVQVDRKGLDLWGIAYKGGRHDRRPADSGAIEHQAAGVGSCPESNCKLPGR